MEPLNQSLGTQINILARSLRLFLEKELSEYGVSPSHWMVLMALGEKNNQVQTELARTVNLDNATVTRVIDKLAEKELLVREQNRDDRREQVVSITKKGRETYKKWNAIGEKVNRIATQNISISEKKSILHSFTIIKENLDSNSNK